MKVLMLAPQPFFEPRGTPFSVLGRLKALSQLGHKVDLVTYHVGQNVDIPGVAIYRTPKIGFIKSVKIGPSVPKLFLDFLLLIKAFRMLQKGRYDLLHTHEEASFFGVLLAKMFRVPHLYDMHSSLTEQLSNFRYSSFRPLVRLFDRLERWVINSSVAVITICPALEDRVRQIDGQVPEVMIENVSGGRYPESVSDEEVHAIKAAYNRLEGKRIILYTGTFEAYQGIDLLIDSAEAVLRRRQDLLFLLAGGKPAQVQHYQDQVSARGLSEYFYFAGVRPAEEVPAFIKLSHILVSPRTDGTNTPLKIYSYLQSGKPIVATNLYTHTQVLNGDVAVLVEPNTEAFAEGILAVLEDPQLAGRLGGQARRLFEADYSMENYMRKTHQIFQIAALGGYAAVDGGRVDEG